MSELLIPTDGVPATHSVEQAFAEARRLVDALGEDHPKAMLAIIRALDLADPGFVNGALAESGITLPAPTHVDENGEPLISSIDLAKSLGVPHEQMVQDIQRIRVQADIGAPNEAHRIQ